MATTTNYGWTTPDDTALVKDGASAIRSLGTAVDTTTKNLNPSTTLGDIEYRSSTANTNTRLGIGSSGQVLTVAAGVPSWATPATFTAPLTTKGDLFGFDTANARIPIGSNGTVLTADSTQALGLKWATASSPTTSFTKLVNGSALSGASITFSSLSGYNKLLLLFVSATSNQSSDLLRLRINGDTASNYNLLEGQITGNSAYSTAVVGANASTGTAAFFFATQSSGSSSASSGYILIDGANSTGDKPYTYSVGSTAGGGNAHKVQTGGGWYSGTSVVSSITVMANAGSLGGSIYIFGGN